METYLQQMKSLRDHMNDHEDKVARLSAEQSEQQTHVRYLRNDLESVRDYINRAKQEVEAISKESRDISKLIVSRQKGLEALDTDYETLSQAWNLMSEIIHERSIRVIEKRLYFEKLEADARLQLLQYQAHYESLEIKQETVDPGEIFGLATQKAPGVEKKNNHETLVDDVVMVEACDDGVGSNSRLLQLQREFQNAEQQVKTLEVENDQLEALVVAFDEKLRALKEEKLAEEDFLQTLHDRLEQLKNYSQDVVCCSCKHAYVIEYEGSKFAIRSTKLLSDG